jgi:hypothetical protein
MTPSFAPRMVSLVALGALTSLAVAGGCGGNSKVAPPQKSSAGSGGTGVSGAGSTAGRATSGGASSGGTSGRGGTGGKGGQGGTMGIDDGGEAGASSGGSGGTAGKGGTGGSAGKGGTAGMSNGGGAQGGSAGQSAGSGGQSGTAGNGSAGMVGVLGTACSPPGDLACAGNHQKLTVLCGGNGTWQPNQTCGTDSFCDSTPGSNVGTCQPVAPGCEDGPGTTFCDDQDPAQLVTCSADAVSTTTEPCAVGTCRGAICQEPPACPVWSDFERSASCTPECPGALIECTGSSSSCIRDYVGLALLPDNKAVIRTMWAQDTCRVCDGTPRAILDVSISLLNAGRALRVTVPPPWRSRRMSTLAVTRRSMDARCLRAAGCGSFRRRSTTRR